MLKIDSICELHLKYSGILGKKLISGMYAQVLTVLNSSHNNLLKVIKFHVHYNIELACIPINGSGN